jgi:hypothetical protein
MLKSTPRFLLITALTFLVCAAARAQDQTPDVSPIVVNGNLPFQISLSVQDMGSADVPTLQSYAIGQVGDDWVVIDGRTNGLHGFSDNGTINFPPADQNTNVWVIDPVTGQTWSRSLSDASAGITSQEFNALSATATEFYQDGSTLYVAGGYLYDSTVDNFTTYDTLTALNLPGIINWVQNDTGTLAQNLLQTTSPNFQVTGGAMSEINGLTLLSVGQDFEGPYTSAANGNYTDQIRTFNIVNTGSSLSIANYSAAIPDPNLRRRDLNVVPILQSDGNGGYIQSLSALSGVFYNGSGAWTVPVEISANGTTSMADPTAPGTFKQGMNNYRSPVISLYDSATDSTHSVLLGGISLQYYDYGNSTFVTDENLPFIDQSTDIVRTDTGNYTQYLLNSAAYPTILSTQTNDQPLLFGAGAQFVPASGLPMIDGLIDMANITSPTLLGYVYGGIEADAGDFGNSTASNLIFDVYYTPVPEPADAAWAFAVGAVLVGVLSRRRTRTG